MSQGLLDGFMNKKGQIVGALSYSYESYNAYFVGSTRTTNENLGSIETNSASFFGSVGVTDYLNIVVSVPYVQIHPTQGFWSDQNDFQDLSLFLKGWIFEYDMSETGSVSLMGAAGVITPLSDYIADAPVSIGSQSTQLEARAIVQYRSSFGFFIAGQAGYGKRGNATVDRGFEVSVPDAWDYIFRTGGNIKKLYADAWFQHQNSRNGTNIGPGVPFPSNEIDFTRIGFTLYHPIPKLENFGVALSTGFTLSGKNVGRSDRFSAAIVYNFSFINPQP